MNDLTLVYYTANTISEASQKAAKDQLIYASGELPLISVSHKPMEFGTNIVVELPKHHLSIYRQALIGAKEADTKYIALIEDDVLYSPEHFKYRPKDKKFAYNLGSWNLYTWQPEQFTHKANGRINLNGLICERQAFIDAMEERFARWPEDDQINLSNWAEPGKYEKNLGVTVQEFEVFYTNPPNIVFSHEDELSFQNLGTRKRLGEFRALTLPYWGRAKDVASLWQ